MNGHVRNLLVQLLRLNKTKEDVTDKKIDSVDKEILKDDLINRFYFRKIDFKNYCSLIFKVYSEKKPCVFFDEVYRKIEDWRIQHNDAIENFESNCAVFKKSVESYKKEREKNPFVFPKESYEKMMDEIKLIIPCIHWAVLPVYEEWILKDDIKIPEENIESFYLNANNIELLYDYCIRSRVWKPSYKGDCNLDHWLNFEVFSRRWGHKDTYEIKRTIDGWEVKFIAINGKSEKNGEGAILGNLEHDGIVYPIEGTKHAFEELWNLADENELSIDTLQQHLQEIANWISKVEKVVGEYQPSWCNYY